MVSVNMSSKELLQTESAESSELPARVGQLGRRLDMVRGAVESWRAGLRRSLLQCQVWGPRGLRVWEKLVFLCSGCFGTETAYMREMGFTICFQEAQLLSRDLLFALGLLLPWPTPSLRVPASIPVGRECHPALPHLCPLAKRTLQQSD